MHPDLGIGASNYLLIQLRGGSERAAYRPLLQSQQPKGHWPLAQEGPSFRTGRGPDSCRRQHLGLTRSTPCGRPPL